MIGFLAPWMAWGAVAAVALPVLAHLLSRTRYHEVAFPATRLVQQAAAATSRLEKPRHRLLMLLRWLTLLLLVLAFMRPHWTPDALASSDEQGIALVLLIDASASMQRTADGLSLFDRAKSRAQQMIDQLDPSRDVATVILVDHAPSSLLPEPTARFSLLHERLIATGPGYSQANWGDTTAAIERLPVSERRSLRVITLSDQQGEQPDLTADHLRIDGPTHNTAIRLVDVRPYPSIQGQPLTAIVELKHIGDMPANIQLSAQFRGQASTHAQTLMPGETRRVEIQLPSPSNERELLEITLNTPDAIAADNITGISIRSQKQTRALVIHDANARSSSIAKRIGLLLNPGKVERVTLPNVELVQTNNAVAVLESADPLSLRNIVLLYQDEIPDALSKALEAYVQAGGGIIQFVGDDTGNLNQATTASDIDFGLQPLRLFQGPARAGLAELPWSGVTNRPIDPSAQSILTDEDGRVMVAEMQRGRGRLIAINTLLDDRPGGLLAEPAFVVLFNELCRYAAPGPAMPAPAKPGDPLPDSLLNASSRDFPQGAESESTHFTAPGLYAAVDRRGEMAQWVYTQLDPSESDTSPQPAWSNRIDNQQADSTTRPDAVGSLRHDSVELWPYVVLVVLGLIAAESILLRTYATPSMAPGLRGAQG